MKVHLVRNDAVIIAAYLDKRNADKLVEAFKKAGGSCYLTTIEIKDTKVSDFDQCVIHDANIVPRRFVAEIVNSDID